MNHQQSSSVQLSEDELLHAAHASNLVIDQLQRQPDYSGKSIEIQILTELITTYQKTWEKITTKSIDLTIPDIHTVGDQKPLGYATAYDFRLAWTTAQQQETMAQERGLQTRLVQPWEGDYVGGALFVYDKNALQALLAKNRPILDRYKWPGEVGPFVEAVIFEVAPADTELYGIVAEAFGESPNQPD